MMIKVGKYEIETSERINKLPEAFVTFAVKNRSTNGNYYWDQCDQHVFKFKLENIRVIARAWSTINKTYKTYVLSIKFEFSQARNGCHAYDGYFVNIGEGPDIHEIIVKMNLNDAFPSEFNPLIEWWC